MLRVLGATILMVIFKSAALWAQADEKQEQRVQRLPKPLDTITVDTSLFAKDFKLVKVDYFESGKFRTTDPRPRVVKEETLLWTLQALRDVKANRLNRLLANPFPRVTFRKLQNKKEVEADARTQGYGLFHDGRWLGKTGPDLKKGDQIKIWTHLGKEGSSGLLEAGATKAVFAKGKRNNQRKRRSG